MCVFLLIFHYAAQTDHHHATAAGGNVIIKALRDAVWTSCAWSGHVLRISSWLNLTVRKFVRIRFGEEQGIKTCTSSPSRSPKALWWPWRWYTVVHVVIHRPKHPMPFISADSLFNNAVFSVKRQRGITLKLHNLSVWCLWTVTQKRGRFSWETLLYYFVWNR